MSDTALQIAQNVAAANGTRSPTTLFGATDPLSRRMLSLLNLAGRTLSNKRGPFDNTWDFLVREHRFTTVAGQQDYALPQGFKDIVTDTLWDQTSNWPARGPLTPQQYQQLKGGLVDTVSIVPYYRLVLDESGTRINFRLDPVPGDDNTELVYEYVSRNWVRDSEASPLSRDTVGANNHIPAYPSELLQLDLTWRLRKVSGLAYAADIAEFELQRDTLFAQSAGKHVIQTAGGGGNPYLAANIEEGSWG